MGDKDREHDGFISFMEHQPSPQWCRDMKVSSSSPKEIKISIDKHFFFLINTDLLPVYVYTRTYAYY